MGHHTIKHWSSTQASVSLSSGEAEFNGVIRGAGQGLGYQALLRDLGIDLPLRVWTDSSAAIGICSRQGLGRLRHLDTHTLWIQQAVRTGRIQLKKVDGAENPADLLTKHSISRDKMLQLVKLYDCEYRDGRAASAPQLRKGGSNKVTMAEADAELHHTEHLADGLASEQEGPRGIARMPHTEMGRAQLDLLFPDIMAPPDEGLDDIARDSDDGTLQTGIRIAEKIAEGMARYGRTRRQEGDS